MIEGLEVSNRAFSVASSAPRATFAAAAGALVLAVSGCGTRRGTQRGPVQPFGTLSQYALFEGDVAACKSPLPEVISYDLNSALFSDYAEKLQDSSSCRQGTHATYRNDDVFEFPVGTG